MARKRLLIINLILIIVVVVATVILSNFFSKPSADITGSDYVVIQPISEVVIDQDLKKVQVEINDLKGNLDLIRNIDSSSDEVKL